MFCRKCGAELPENSLFCSMCGERVLDVGASNGGEYRQGQLGPQSQASLPAARPENDGHQPLAEQQASPRRARTGLIIGAAAVIAVVAVVVAATVILPYATGVRGDTNFYTWEELSAISKTIADAGTEHEAVEIAKKHHLCNSEGKLDGKQVKGISLSNGESANARIIGFSHDDKSGGSGKAGITFQIEGYSSFGKFAERAMNSTATNAGGWKDSELRSWLNTEYLSLLPSDLRAAIVPVDKLTNNEGHTDSASSVAATTDELWLLSEKEVCATVSCYSKTGHPEFDSVGNAEGRQYKLFRDEGVSGVQTSEALKTSDSWWLRSSSNGYRDCFRAVRGIGLFGEGAGMVGEAPADHTELACPCFCI